MSYDAEKIAADYLRETTGMRVRSTHPDDRDTPWVRLIELSAPQAPGRTSDHLVAHYFQLDVYCGEGKDSNNPRLANEMGDSLRAALVLFQGSRDGAVVTGCRVENSYRDEDEDFEPPRYRRIITATIWMHP